MSSPAQTTPGLGQGAKTAEQPMLPSGVAIKDFLLKDYELKVTYLSSHFSRMWTRFNFFITIESALTGLMFVSSGSLRPAAPWLAAANVVVSLIWYAFGAQDRFLVELYREHVRDAANKIIHGATEWTEFRYVGSEAYIAQDLRGKTHEVLFYNRGLLSWRIRPVSTTRLAAFVPLFLFTIWAIVAVLFWVGILRPG